MSSEECTITRRNVGSNASSDTFPTRSDTTDEVKPIPKKQPLCLLRPFKQQDEPAIKTIIADATMETVSEFFWAALISEIFPQLAFTAIAIGFVGFNLPFMFCISLVPAAVVLMYAFIWSAHMFKVLELHEDLSNISNTYQQQKNTGLWVAEVYDSMESNELAAHFNLTKKVIYNFVDEVTVEKRGDKLSSYKQRTVVGCLAVTHSFNTPNKAWLRRFAVQKDYQRRGIATNLLELAIKFCRKQEYTGIDLITTHCHHKARAMYLKAGFNVTMNTRYFLNVAQPTYLFSMPLNRKSDSENELDGGQTVLEEEKSYAEADSVHVGQVRHRGGASN